MIVGDDKEQLYESLNNFVGEIINAKVTINVVRGELAVPKLMQTYRDDFLNDENLIKFIYKYLDDPEIDLS